MILPNDNEEAREYWTPKDAVQLMFSLVLDPVANDVESSTYVLYDGAVGVGGMLSVAEQRPQEFATERELEAIRPDILDLERESEGLLADISGLEN